MACDGTSCFADAATVYLLSFPYMDSAEALFVLGRKLAETRAWKERVRLKFEHDIQNGTGIPHTCSNLSIRNSGREYRQAIEATDKVLQQYADCILYGSIPEDLGDKNGSDESET